MGWGRDSAKNHALPTTVTREVCRAGNYIQVVCAPGYEIQIILLAHELKIFNRQCRRSWDS